MPLEDPGAGIVNAYLQGRKLLESRLQFQQEQQLREQQFQQAIKEFNDRMKMEEKEFQARMGLEQSKFNLQKATAIPAFSEAISKGLIPSTPVPPEGMTGDKIGDLVRQGRWDEAYQLQSTGLKDVLGQEINAPSLSRYLETQRQLMLPEEQSKIATASGISKALLPQDLAKIQATFEGREKIAALTTEAANKRAQLLRESNEKIVNTKGQYQLAAAKMKGMIDPTTVATYASDMRNGLTEISQVPPLARGPALTLNKQMGEVPIAKSRLDSFKTDMANIDATVTFLQNTLDRFKDNFGKGAISKIGAKTAEVFNVGEFGNALNQANGLLGTIARTVSTEAGRLSDPDIQRAKGLSLNPALSVESNQKNVINTLKEIMNKRANIKLGFVPPNQRQDLFNQLGIDWLKAKGATAPTLPTGGLRIKYDDGTTEIVPDTPENRRKYGVK